LLTGIAADGKATGTVNKAAAIISLQLFMADPRYGSSNAMKFSPSHVRSPLSRRAA